VDGPATPSRSPLAETEADMELEASDKCPDYGKCLEDWAVWKVLVWSAWI
jgi:hypothetical protein